MANCLTVKGLIVATSPIISLNTGQPSDTTDYTIWYYIDNENYTKDLRYGTNNAWQVGSTIALLVDKKDHNKFWLRDTFQYIAAATIGGITVIWLLVTLLIFLVVLPRRRLSVERQAEQARDEALRLQARHRGSTARGSAASPARRRIDESTGNHSGRSSASIESPSTAANHAWAWTAGLICSAATLILIVAGVMAIKTYKTVRNEIPVTGLVISTTPVEQTWSTGKHTYIEQKTWYVFTYTVENTEYMSGITWGNDVWRWEIPWRC